jgi:hypothetical protein
VNVLLGPPGTVNLALEIAKTSSEITVTDEAPIIQAENGDVSTTMNEKQISEVPNPGNDLTYIVQTAPGVIMNTDSGATGGIQNGAANFSILGMPGSSYSYTMDGMSITDNGQNFIAGGPFGCAKKKCKLHAVREMREGPSKPLCRERLQTATSCCGTMATVVNVVVKSVDRPRHVWMRETNASEPPIKHRNLLRRRQNRVSEGLRDQSGGNLSTGQTASGV